MICFALKISVAGYVACLQCFYFSFPFLFLFQLRWKWDGLGISCTLLSSYSSVPESMAKWVKWPRVGEFVGLGEGYANYC